MNKLLDKEYFHFGSSDIYKELWLHIQMDQFYKNYSKPLGGLWTSPQNPDYLCDWLRYMEFKDQYNFDLYVANKDSCLVKFKKDSKLLSIETTNDFNNLRDSGFTTKLDTPINLHPSIANNPIYEIPNYEKIAEFYDLMYVDYFVKDCFKQFSVNTMLAINPDSIEYYKSINANYLYHEITSISDKKYISEPNKDYYKFLLYVNNLFKEIKANTYEEFIEKLYKLKNSIIEDLEKNFDFQKLNLPNNIDLDKLIRVTTLNVYKEKYQEGKKLLKRL